MKVDSAAWVKKKERKKERQCICIIEMHFNPLLGSPPVDIFMLNWGLKSLTEN